MKPRFDHLVGGNDDNKLKLGYSDEANSLYAAPATYTSKQPDAVERTARSEVLQLGGDPSDRTALLGQFEVQFGRFKGKTFKWLLENGLGYSAWFVTSMAGETATSASLSVNKHAFKEYLESFPEGKEAIAVKKAEKTKNPSAVALLFGRSSLSPHAIANRLQRRDSPKNKQPDVTSSTPGKK